MGTWWIFSVNITIKYVCIENQTCCCCIPALREKYSKSFRRRMNFKTTERKYIDVDDSARMRPFEFFLSILFCYFCSKSFFFGSSAEYICRFADTFVYMYAVKRWGEKSWMRRVWFEVWFFFLQEIRCVSRKRVLLWKFVSMWCDSWIFYDLCISRNAIGCYYHIYRAVVIIASLLHTLCIVSNIPTISLDTNMNSYEI